MPDPDVFDPVERMSSELSLPRRGVAAVVALLEEGATVPFIARYRKEATGSLDEEQIRTIQERHAYLLELEKRRQAILASIEEQGKLTDELRAKLQACTTKTELEDLYLPYKPKRRTRATIARDKGLQPLADAVLGQPDTPAPEEAAQQYVDPEKEVQSVDDALAGARDIVAEHVAEDARVRQLARDHFAREGQLTAEVNPDKKDERTKFESYYGFREKTADIPSHRFLAVRRGEREEILRTRVEVDEERLLPQLRSEVGVRTSPWAPQLVTAIDDGYKRLIAPSVENDVRSELKKRADREAVEVFANNLRNLLLAAPMGLHAVVGIDPGLRTGCKCAAVDNTGKYQGSVTIYPHQGETRRKGAAEALLTFLREHRPYAVAVGNGTAGRETEAFVRDTLREAGEDLGEPMVVLVSESGASVYSASPLARKEFPDLDVTIRGAISIARRLQDPLAELVKIDPKSIGVGQYQHDVNQNLLKRKLDDVVESCVNHVGVELNSASAPLLSYVAGIGPGLATKIVQHREVHGAFASRKAVLDVTGLGPRTYEQAAGFLRVSDSEHPLDNSAVHPERYALVDRMAADLGVEVGALVGDAELVDRIDIQRYLSDEVGEPTLRDIVQELKKPGRDPRATFEPPAFREDVNTLEDLTPGMTLEGVVTNVTHFGAFVDIGVKQDGLVHVSQLADRFVRDPAEVAKVGDKLKVRVLEVDLERKRISLTCKSEGGGGRERRGRGDRPAREDRGGPAGARDDRRGRGRRNDRGGGRNERRGRGPREDRGGDRRTSRGDSGSLKYNPFANLLKK